MKYLALALLAGIPFYGLGNYPLHLIIMCLLWGYVIAFAFFIAVMFWRPQGIWGVR